MDPPQLQNYSKNANVVRETIGKFWFSLKFELNFDFLKQKKNRY